MTFARTTSSSSSLSSSSSATFGPLWKSSAFSVSVSIAMQRLNWKNSLSNKKKSKAEAAVSAAAEKAAAAREWQLQQSVGLWPKIWRNICQPFAVSGEGVEEGRGALWGSWKFAHFKFKYKTASNARKLKIFCNLGQQTICGCRQQRLTDWQIGGLVKHKKVRALRSSKHTNHG